MNGSEGNKIITKECHVTQVPTTMDAFMLYGPVVSDGYGVCYNPHPSYMVFVITAFNSEEKTVAEHFANTLVANLREMKDLCTAEAAAKHDDNSNAILPSTIEYSNGQRC